ncbi:MAG: RNA-binding protein [Fibrobacterota bacterium]
MVKKLYVGNLSFTSTEDEVRGIFSALGEVHSVNIITDRETGRPRGFCFVEMENADQAIADLNGKEFGGRKLTVNEARSREERPRGGQGGGGGGGGGGFRGGRGFGNR